MKRTPLTRKKSLQKNKQMVRKKRLRKRSKKGSNRVRNKPQRDEYKRRNPVCEWPGCCRPTSDVHHVKPMYGGSVEHVAAYFAVCGPCHDRIQPESLKAMRVIVPIKQRKGEWVEWAQEKPLFGRYYTTEDGEVIDA